MCAQGAGHGKIPCLYFNLHGYLRVIVTFDTLKRLTPIEVKK
jgi:hypothetical protein